MMLFTTLALFAALPAYILALPTPLDSVHAGIHKLVKRAELLKALFPAGQGSSSWSTARVPNSAGLHLAAFNAFEKGRLPVPANAPDGSEALHTHFDKGSYDYQGPAGGMSFFARPLDFSNAKEITFTYSLYFSADFDFNKGGKLPGMYGGDNPHVAIGCSGGRRDVRCWSARLMFRKGGDGELYSYFPQPSNGPQYSGNKQLCSVKPYSTCNEKYGASVGRGSWKWTPGAWDTVTQRIKLNDVGQQNGEVEIIVNGTTAINLKGLVLRGSKEGRFQGIQVQSFFGGHDPSWASPKAQDIWTKDYSIAVTQTF